METLPAKRRRLGKQTCPNVQLQKPCVSLKIDSLHVDSETETSRLMGQPATEEVVGQAASSSGEVNTEKSEDEEKEIEDK